MSALPSPPLPIGQRRESVGTAEELRPRPGTTLPLLVEIGCEEIPARFVTGAQQNLADGLRAALADARLLTDSAPDRELVRSYSTPRRLVVSAPYVLKKQPDQLEEILGPPVKVAFDAGGKPTRAAEGFATKHGVAVEGLTQVATTKGEYLAVRRTTEGRAAYDVLREALSSVITGLPWAKSMYWTSKSDPRFVRPIRWLLAILGEGRRARIIPFEIAGVSAGCWTYRHRRLGNHRMRVRSFADYAEKLREGMVEFDPERRREKVRADIRALLQDSGLSVVEDKGLEDWVVASTEWPTAILGGFEERFLKLPREILVTVMRDHQKYFAVEGKAGNLEPRFITVLNVEGDPRDLIRAGHERVLTARFTDAEFFWNADQKVPLRDRLALLEKVTYHDKLGSYGDKVRRMQLISDEVSLPPVVPTETTGHVRRAISLSKCDLTTQMVQEFPELQGVVGGLYAREQGELQEVWQGIYDHYHPVGFEDECPNTRIGAMVSFVDKFDTVLAGVAAGLEPTGSSDPFALRRHAGGLIKLLLEVELRINLRRLFERAYARVELGKWRPGNEVYGAFQSFVGDRLRYYLESVKGIRYDTVRAVLSAGYDEPLDAFRRAEALEKVRQTEDFEALAAGAKRIRNILTKSATSNDWSPGEVDGALLEAGLEVELYEAYLSVADEAGKLSQAGQYEEALKTISTLRPSVDRFFDKILVMAEDKTVRQNRLRLLDKLCELFSGIADLSQIESTTLSHVDAPTLRAAT